MSLAGFQQAMADLISSPERCMAVRTRPQDVLGKYELSDRERRRLEAIVAQKGMSTTCSLYRSNRVTPIYTLLNFSCLALGEALEEELNLYWGSSEFLDLQWHLEITRFAQFQKRRMLEGALCNRWLGELLDFELAANELRYLPRRKIREALAQAGPGGECGRYCLSPLVRVVRFSYDAAMLLDALSGGAGVNPQVPEGEFFCLLSVLGETLEVTSLDLRVGRILDELRRGLEFSGTAEELESLVRMRVIVAM